jgi:hypothetical protein
MKNIIAWHREILHGEPHHIALNIDLAQELEGLDTVTYQEYTRMCKRRGICAMREETFLHKMGKL